MSEWIRVDERLPEEGQAVLYYFSMVGRHRGHFTRWTDPDGYTYNVFHGKEGFLSDDVTHWMPDDGQITFPERPE
jgi:hypothetical protein